MKSIVAVTEIFTPDGGEHWRSTYNEAVRLLGSYCVEDVYLDPLNGQHPTVADYELYNATHVFTHPSDLGQFILDYSYEKCGDAGRHVIFGIYDTSDEEDLYVDENIAAAMDQIRASVNDALFHS